MSSERGNNDRVMSVFSVHSTTVVGSETSSLLLRRAQVKHVILCGHTSCGAVAGSLKFPPEAPGTVNLWISDLKARLPAFQRRRVCASYNSLCKF